MPFIRFLVFKYCTYTVLLIVRDIIAVTLGSPQGSPRIPLGWLPVTCRRHVPVVYSLYDPRGLTSLRICLSHQSILFHVYAL